jgi:peptide/nickel transport system permease protein
VWSFALRRIGASLIALWLATLVVFAGIRALPGGPARALAGEEGDAAMIAAINAKYGFDQPVPVQYVRWIGNALRGDLGESVRTGLAVTPMVTSRVPITLELAGLSMLVALVLGIPTGVLAAVRRGTPVDYAANAIGLSGLSVPNFWLGLMLILVFAINLQWFPASGFVPIVSDPLGNLARMALPAFVLGSGFAAVVMRQMRSAMLATLDSDFIRTARAKGLSEWSVVASHAMRNSLITVVMVVGLQLGLLISGAIVTEQIFVIPGFGRLIIGAVFQRDYAVIQGVVLVSAAGYIALNLVVDLLYSVLNPRIRVTGGPA